MLVAVCADVRSIRGVSAVTSTVSVTLGELQRELGALRAADRQVDRGLRIAERRQGGLDRVACPTAAAGSGTRPARW